MSYEEIRVIVIVYFAFLLPLLIFVLNKSVLPKWVSTLYLIAVIICALGWELWFTFGWIDGDAVDIRFANFSLTPLLVVPGELISISTDVLFEEKTNSPYYLARVRVSEEGLKMLGERKMRPGMEVGVIVKTGSRTLLTYLLHPLTRRVAFSMKEE